MANNKFIKQVLEVLSKVFALILFVVLLLLILSITPFILMLTWNWLAPTFWVAAPHLTFFQSVGISVFLSLVGTLLFGSRSKND